MAKAKAAADVNLCKGCRLCVGACPVQAIEPLKAVSYTHLDVYKRQV